VVPRADHGLAAWIPIHFPFTSISLYDISLSQHSMRLARDHPYRGHWNFAGQSDGPHFTTLTTLELRCGLIVRSLLSLLYLKLSLERQNSIYDVGHKKNQH
jgi:hypothetical protein